MLLDRGDAVDALVIGIGVVVSGEQAFDLGDAEFFQCLQPQMAVQKEPGSSVWIRPIALIELSTCE